jgi:hypothetical protein
MQLNSLLFMCRVNTYNNKNNNNNNVTPSNSVQVIHARSRSCVGLLGRVLGSHPAPSWEGNLLSALRGSLFSKVAAALHS